MHAKDSPEEFHLPSGSGIPGNIPRGAGGNSLREDLWDSVVKLPFQPFLTFQSEVLKSQGHNPSHKDKKPLQNILGLMIRVSKRSCYVMASVGSENVSLMHRGCRYLTSKSFMLGCMD